MSADNGKRDPVDVLIFLLFWIRVSALAAFGAGFAWLGLRGSRADYCALGVGLKLLAIAGYFCWHPKKRNLTLFMLFAIPGLLAFSAGFAL